MKKLFAITIVFIMMLGSLSILKSDAASNDSAVIKGAIAKYKNKNYLGCISDLRLYTEKDPSSTIAWYYLGNSYMNIAMKDEAHAAFDKVIALNNIPKLTSYSIQAKMCLENENKCNYQNFNMEQIKQLKNDPYNFLESYFANLNNTNKDMSTIEIEKLINGEYYNNIHPNAKEFIMQEKAKMKKYEINENQQNNNIPNFSMMFDNNFDINDNYAELIKSYQTDKTQQITPEMIQMMMMTNSIQNF